MSAIENPTVAVTGACGFIGSRLVELLLERGARVRALARYGSAASIGHLAETLASAKAEGREWVRDGRLEIVHGDVADARCVRELIRDCDRVFHLAALIGIPYSYRAPESYLRVNLHGTLNVLEACREECPERVVLTSTSEVYGSAVRVPMDEDHPLRAQSPYAASKIAADALGISYWSSFDLPVAILRPFNAFGPRQSTRAAIPTILAQALSDDREAIRLGNTDAVRDFTFVDDVAAGFLAIADAPLEAVAGRALNMGSGHGRTILEVARAAMDAAGRRKPIVEDAGRLRPEKSEVDRLVCDSTRFRDATGWVPETSFEDGLARTAAWIRARPGIFDPDAYRL